MTSTTTLTIISSGSVVNGEEPRLCKLTNRSTEKARRCRERLGNPQFAKVCYPFYLSMEQAGEIISQIMQSDPRTIRLSCLFPQIREDLGHPLTTLFERMSHSPLNEYLKQPEAPALVDSAQETVSRLRTIFRPDDHILVVAPSPTVSAVMHEMITYFKWRIPDFRNTVQNRIVGEFEGYKLNLHQHGKKFTLSSYELI